MVTNAGELLQTAVHHHSAASRKGLLERAFAFFFSGFVYNQIWEDPRVDLEALELTRESRILTISSGGCNVLNYLVDGPHSITAVDVNPSHLYLTRLKIAALKGLPDFEEFFRFFGEANSKQNTENYYRCVRQQGHQVYWKTARYRFWIRYSTPAVRENERRNRGRYGRDVSFTPALRFLNRATKQTEIFSAET